jgi:hypothetical protein
MGILDRLFNRTQRLAKALERAAPGAAPDLVAIDHDDYHAEHVGHTANGRQFFLTTPFLPDLGADRPGCEFVALYLFDDLGRLLDAKIDSLGPRATLDGDHRRRMRDQRLLELGDVTFDRIEVRPFSVERFGTKFGLVASEDDDDPGVWRVDLLPGNYMAFWEPWDSGVYDT